ncbi:FMN-dependent alpha-hydroxy acid dehydrogenase [Tilletiopsis washingtonensis]|uniref:FMN-dependent alpha-hydroxy acid dehydrogenase n=1 Tax=Tilletiopsis washingtonensis TaxID=58919 RepID=A0A316ZB86_9BASI|nr:FMN-dependent alpha-hydroxy acid dehydrogenase [Tilletiopsis washingtonensis]PWN97525.1 FMN-dependent alpha-hydroxy acid dehydrogenase [Tilletiopsis washingtonensis]
MSVPKSSWMREIYVNGLGGTTPLASTTYELLRAKAQEVLEPKAYAYVAGSAGSEETEASNQSALRDWQIVPRMLAGVDLAQFDSSVTLFGRRFPTPLVVSPIGVQAQLHKDCDVATASAARELGIPFTLSSATSTPMEQVITGAGYDEEGDEGQEAWFQLYWPSDDDITRSLLARAKKAGYKVLVVTLDTWSLGWRPRDLDAAYNPFLHGEGVANCFSDPVFVEKYCEGKSPLRKDASADDTQAASIAAIGLLTPGISRAWADLALLRELWGDAPIILKGIQALSDAQRAVEAGMDGIWVSNHGARQVGGACGALQALRPIAQYARSQGKTVIFDSGVRTGADVIKALALGAHAVGVGRPYAWGLAVGGEEGVAEVLKGLLADFELTAGLSGHRSLADIGAHSLIRRGEEARL